MSLATTVSAMAAAGCSAQQIADVVAAHEAAEEARRNERRAKDAERQRKSRLSRGVTVTERDSIRHLVTQAQDEPSREYNNPPPCAEPEPNKTTYPTTSEAKASSVEPQPVQTPLDGEILPPSPSHTEAVPGKARASPSPSTRGVRLPADFYPSPSTIEWCRSEQRLTDDQFSDCLDEFRDYWVGVPGSRGLKCDWDGTFRNAVRKRFSSGGPRQAYAAGNKRSDGSRLGTYQRAAAFVRAQNDVSAERGGVLDL